MFKLTIVGTIVALAAAMKHRHPINHEMVAVIRERSPAWESHDPESNPLKMYSRDELLDLVGTYIPEAKVVNDNGEPAKALPTNFDARTQWGTKIHPIRDQAQCGSCWAFGATEALSDRFAIAGKDVVLSPQDMVSCDTYNYGCDGGYLSYAW